MTQGFESFLDTAHIYISIFSKLFQVFFMEKEILEKIKIGCTMQERILIHIFRKTFIKIFKIGITWGFNNK